MQPSACPAHPLLRCRCGLKARTTRVSRRDAQQPSARATRSAASECGGWMQQRQQRARRAHDGGSWVICKSTALYTNRGGPPDALFGLHLRLLPRGNLYTVIAGACVQGVAKHSALAISGLFVQRRGSNEYSVVGLVMKFSQFGRFLALQQPFGRWHALGAQQVGWASDTLSKTGFDPAGRAVGILTSVHACIPGISLNPAIRSRERNAPAVLSSWPHRGAPK